MAARQETKQNGLLRAPQPGAARADVPGPLAEKPAGPAADGKSRPIQKQMRFTRGCLEMRCGEVISEIESFLRGKAPGLSEDRITDICLVLGEVLPNAYQHGRKKLPGGSFEQFADVRLSYMMLQEKPFLFSVTVKDEGEGITQEQLDAMIRRIETGEAQDLLNFRGRGLLIMLNTSNNPDMRSKKGEGTCVDLFFHEERPSVDNESMKARAGLLRGENTYSELERGVVNNSLGVKARAGLAGPF